MFELISVPLVYVYILCQSMSCSQFHSFCSRCLWIFRAFCDYVWILDFFYFYKECYWYFGSECMESVDCFGYCVHFTIVILVVQEYGISFHLFLYSLISSTSVLRFHCRYTEILPYSLIYYGQFWPSMVKNKKILCITWSSWCRELLASILHPEHSWDFLNDRLLRAIYLQYQETTRIHVPREIYY
jgi:hypothetical protein